MALDFPTSPTDGQIYDNYYWDNTNSVWRLLGDSLEVHAAISNTPTGSYTDGYDYEYVSFTSDGTLNVTRGGLCDILLVGGGGGGGQGINVNQAQCGGGGGAGGYIYKENLYLPAGSHSVTIGAGGASAPQFADPGGDGGSTLFYSLTAVGGGGGNGMNPFNMGRRGGSGGSRYGVAYDYFVGEGIDGQGNDGGTGVFNLNPNQAGGGGGAGAVGGDGSNATTSGGDGGAGLANSLTGSSVFYAGGGGGAGTIGGSGGVGGGGDGSSAGGGVTSGTANTGGGGGGGDVTNPSGAGGSGIVIVRVRV